MQTRVFRIALTVAACAHAVAIVAFVLRAPPRVAPVRMAPPEAPVATLEMVFPVEEEPTPAPVATARAEPVERAERDSNRAPPRKVSPGATEPRAEEELTASASVPSDPSAVNPPGAWSPTIFNASRAGRMELGLSRAAAGRFARAPAESPDAPAMEAAIESLDALVDARDRQLGLMHEGPLVSVARDVTMSSSNVDDETSAVFVATTDRDGKVVHVVATGATGSADGWDEIAAEILRGMAAKRIRVPHGAAGLILSFRVESRLRTVDGHMTAASHHSAPVFVSPDHPDAQRPASLALGTPDPECRTLAGTACTGSVNIDPTDALIAATTRPGRTVVVESLGERTVR